MSRALASAVSFAVVAGLVLGACGDGETAVKPAEGTGAAGGTAGTATGGSAGASRGGSGGAGRGGTTGTGGDGPSGGAGQAGANDDGGASGTSNEGGAAGDGGSLSCESDQQPPSDDCVYPESWGGGAEPDACGVTEGAWYGVGGSDRTLWPALADAATPGGFGSGFVGGVWLDSRGYPVVQTGCTAHLYDGDSWRTVDAPEVPDNRGPCAFGLDPSDRLYAAYTNTEFDEYFALYVARLEPDGSWQPLGAEPPMGEPLVDAYESLSVRFVFDPAGSPAVAWTEWYNDTAFIDVKHWDEGSGEWSAFQAAPQRVGELLWGDRSAPELVLHPDGPIVAASGDTYPDVLLLQFDGTAWVDRIDGALSAALSERQLPAPVELTQDAGGAPVVYFRTDDDLVLFRHTGSRWEALSPDDSVLDGLPESVRIAATFGAAPDGDAHLRRFDDCRWTGLSASDRGGGVSNTTETVRAVAASADQERACVAWSEGDDPTALLRCHDLPAR